MFDPSDIYKIEFNPPLFYKRMLLKRCRGFKFWRNPNKCEVKHAPSWDVFYCFRHNKWLEPKCGDKECRFCSTRLRKPSDIDRLAPVAELADAPDSNPGV